MKIEPLFNPKYCSLIRFKRNVQKRCTMFPQHTRLHRKLGHIWAKHNKRNNIISSIRIISISEVDIKTFDTAHWHELCFALFVPYIYSIRENQYKHQPNKTQKITWNKNAVLRLNEKYELLMTNYHYTNSFCPFLFKNFVCCPKK